MLQSSLTALVALLIGGLGGGLFHAVGAPLPWTLGSMTAAAIVAIAGSRWLMPRQVRDAARPVVGVLAGSAFTPAIIAAIPQWWGGIALVAGYSIVTGLAGFVFFRKICRLDPVTAFFASTPAGLGEMSLLGGSLGGNMRTLVLIHSIRITAVVFTIPLLLQLVLHHPIGRAALPAAASHGIALRDWIILILCGLVGYGLGKVLRLPGGIMIVTMIGSAIIHGAGLSEAVPPAWLVALVQVIIGSVAGARFASVRWNELGSTLVIGIIWAAVLLAMSAAVAAAGSAIVDRPFEALLLALAPGGMVEMTVITYALGIEVAFVVTCQVCRNFFVVAFAPLIFRHLPGGRPPGPPGNPPPS